MKLNNSFKLAIANFALFWKIFLYKIIAFGVSLLFTLPVWRVLKHTFYNSGFNALIKRLFTNATFISIPELMGQILDIIKAFFSGVASLASNNVFVLIYLVILLFIIVPFLFKLSDVPASECAYSYMSSLNKSSFTINFITMLDKSMGYSILRAVMEIPFWFAFIGSIYGILCLGTLNSAMAIFAPMILFVFVVSMIALNFSFFNGFAPSVVVFNTCASRAFGKGIKALRRNFFSVLSSFIVVIVVSVCLLYLFGVYALIVEIPILALVNAIFGQVLFFESQGMDYYLSPDKIISPRKLECADKMAKMKNII
ncbi:MAG: hypothetical protein MR904_04245 [Clostridia bacterium]|nr:hypothetical protein [Clostridia bacterium]